MTEKKIIQSEFYFHHKISSFLVFFFYSVTHFVTQQSLYKQVRKRLVQVQLCSINTVHPNRRNIIHPKMTAKHRCNNKLHKFQVNPYNCNGLCNNLHFCLFLTTEKKKTHEQKKRAKTE